jgi:hypothetical protein
MTQKLSLSNEQLEFLLRQKLLSLNPHFNQRLTKLNNCLIHFWVYLSVFSSHQFSTSYPTNNFSGSVFANNIDRIILTISQN